ncbi:hypothetical protein KUTeg_010537 [Tegillarca granosa]|uniref:RING-type domain-containing protein n=1 Tax=Tegillarca granosa TaxID=220873 RepID=A0ABQ9F3F0_TEGGR|nr:hypothetical protein KUTeg_010537 [Tegillarca granosa]
MTVTEHNVQMFTAEESDDIEEKTCSISVGTILYISSDLIPEWIEEAIHKCQWTKGKVNCPKCKGRLGSFDFLSSGKCSCGKSVLPSIHILQNRVDHHLVMKIQGSDESTDKFQHRIADDDDGECRMKSASNIDVKMMAKSGRNWNHDAKFNSLPSNSLDQSFDKETEVTNNDNFPPTITSDLPSDRLSRYPDISLKGFSCIPTGRSNRTTNNRLSNNPEISTPHAQLSNNRIEHLSNITSSNRYSYLPVEEDIAGAGQNLSNHGHHGNKARDRDSFPSMKTSERMSKLNEDFDSEDSQNVDDLMYPDEHTCAICYELYCSPMQCRPCNHVFCECCLRLLDLIGTLQDLYEGEYKRRLRQQRKFLDKNFYPLPHESRVHERHCNRGGRRGRQAPPANLHQPDLRNHMPVFVLLWFLLIFIGLVLHGISTAFTLLLSPFVMIYRFLFHLKDIRLSSFMTVCVLLALSGGVVFFTFNIIHYLRH